MFFSDIIAGTIERCSNAARKQLDSLPFTDGYFFLSLLPIRAAQAILDRAGVRAEEEKGIGQWGGGRAMARLIRKILLLDFHVGRLVSRTGVDLPGLSCYAIRTAQRS